MDKSSRLTHGLTGACNHIYIICIYGLDKKTVLSSPAHLPNTLKFDVLPWWRLALLESMTQHSLHVYDYPVPKKTPTS